MCMVTISRRATYTHNRSLQLLYVYCHRLLGGYAPTVTSTSSPLTTFVSPNRTYLECSLSTLVLPPDQRNFCQSCLSCSNDLWWRTRYWS